MKKISAVLLFVFCLLFFSSCLTTFHPIYTPKDLVYKKELTGKWKIVKGQENEAAEIIPLASDNSVDLPGKISTIKDKGYLVTYKDGHGKITEQYIAFLASIGNYLYFDFYPIPGREEESLDDFYRFHFTKMHKPYRVNMLKNGGFEISQLDKGFLEKLIEQKKMRISHETDSDGNIWVTASTQELQQYILKYGDNPEAVENDKIIFTH
jgi:hypothetical protein